MTNATTVRLKIDIIKFMLGDHKLYKILILENYDFVVL